MARAVRLGLVAFAGLVAAKLLSDVPGVERLSEIAGFAIAAETDDPAPPASIMPPPAPDPEAMVLPELLAAIAIERDALAARAAALDEREAELDLARATLLKQNEELSRLREDVTALLERAKGTEEAEVGRLVKIYEAMKPAEAASILQDADLELVVLVIAAMAERNAGPILAAMSPDRASAVSRILLERSRLPGDQHPVLVQLN